MQPVIELLVQIRNALSGGGVTIQASDIEIGAVELKDGATDTRAKVKSDGVDNAVVVMQNAPPTGSATSANQTASNAKLDTIITQTDGLEASLTSMDGKMPVKGQATKENSTPVTMASDQEAGKVKSDFLEVALTSISALNGDLYPSTDVTAYKSFYLQLTGTWSGTVSIQGSNDNTNWVQIAVLSLASNSTGTQNTTTGNGLYMGQMAFKYFRIRVTSYSSGTVAGVMLLNSFPLSGFHTMSVISNSSGPGASGANLSTGNPNRIAVAFNTTQPTVTTGQQVDVQGTNRGALFVANGVDPFAVRAENTTLTATIANAASLSGAIDLAGFSQVGLVMPAAWTAANLTFQGCDTLGGTYQDIYDSAGNELTVIAAASRCIADIPELAPFRFIKIRSGTSGTPVSQGASRDIIVVAKS